MVYCQKKVKMILIDMKCNKISFFCRNKFNKMKKLLFLGIVFLGGFGVTFGQEIATNAVGLRFASQNGLGTELSFQRKITSENRVELDLGWQSEREQNIFKLSGIYQWVFALENNFQYFLGAGASIGNSSFQDNNNTFVSASGDVGIEYIFNFPLQISLDFRPEIAFGNQKNGFGPNFALSFRYLY